MMSMEPFRRTELAILAGSIEFITTTTNVLVSSLIKHQKRKICLNEDFAKSKLNEKENPEKKNHPPTLKILFKKRMQTYKSERLDERKSKLIKKLENKKIILGNKMSNFMKVWDKEVIRYYF